MHTPRCTTQRNRTASQVSHFPPVMAAELEGETSVLEEGGKEAISLPFSIRGIGDVRMEIYDLLGRKVDVLTDKTYAAGTHRVEWNGSGQASGVYFARMSVDGKAVGVQKVVRR